MIEKLNAKKAKDIFCGNYHSFYINEKDQVFAWGMNNHGQLGIGHKENTCVPTQIKALEGQKVIQIAGGEHHTIAVTSEGKVYCWGRNDEGQIGRGDLYSEFKRRVAKEEHEAALLKEQQDAERKLKEEEDDKQR